MTCYHCDGYSVIKALRTPKKTSKVKIFFSSMAYKWKSLWNKN